MFFFMRVFIYIHMNFSLFFETLLLLLLILVVLRELCHILIESKVNFFHFVIIEILKAHFGEK